MVFLGFGNARLCAGGTRGHAIEDRRLQERAKPMTAEAMPKAMQMAREHGDNAALQGALEKFRGLMSEL